MKVMVVFDWHGMTKEQQDACPVYQEAIREREETGRVGVADLNCESCEHDCNQRDGILKNDN
jgi:hypothetical protein